MERAEFQSLVTQAGVDHPTWFDLPTDAPPSDEELTNLGTTLGAALPSDYKWFLKTYGGGDFAMARVYSADPRSDLHILACQLPVLKDYLAFSDNGCGDLFLFSRKGDRYADQVYLWNHDTDEIELVGEDGFLSFVAREAHLSRSRDADVRAPAVTTRRMDPGIIESFRRLVGRRLVRVFYAGREYSDDDMANDEPAVDEVDLAVLLDFDGGSLRLDWARDGWTEGLAVQFDGSMPAAWSSTERQNARGWNALVGRDLASVDLVWHCANNEALESIFALQLDFHCGVPVLIALGELDGGQLRYTPDSLLVVFNPEVGKGYSVSNAVNVTSVMFDREV